MIEDLSSGVPVEQQQQPAPQSGFGNPFHHGIDAAAKLRILRFD